MEPAGTGMKFHNRTQLDTARLKEMILCATTSWPDEGLTVFIRYSRGAEFSGTCYYKDNRIYVNLGRQNAYPYRLRTHIARARSNRRGWWREAYSLEMADAYQLVLFVFLHEFYHWLVRRARRNTRQKEARCDRFAARVLVDCYGTVVRDSQGGLAQREEWDFQDLEGFVAAARPLKLRAARRPQPAPGPTSNHPTLGILYQQLLLFNM